MEFHTLAWKVKKFHMSAWTVKKFHVSMENKEIPFATYEIS
jgi:hypothetical protein